MALSSPKPDNVSWSRFRGERLICTHFWTLEHFSSCPQFPGAKLSSPIFFAEAKSTPKLKWSMELFPNGLDEKGSDDITLYLYLCSSACPVFAKYELTLLNSSQQIIKKVDGEKTFDTIYNGWGMTNLISRDSLLNKSGTLLADDELTIQCVICSTVIADVPNPRRPFSKEVYMSKSSEKLALLLEQEKFSDITLRVHSKEFRAHKVILAATSPVFEAMFEHEMKEKSSNHVDIEDCDAEAISAMLRFMYSGERPVLNDNTIENILAVADKYAVEDLKDICETHLGLTVTADTAANLLYLADKYNATNLNEVLLCFIKMDIDNVMASDSWKFLIQHRRIVLKNAFKQWLLYEPFDSDDDAKHKDFLRQILV